MLEYDNWLDIDATDEENLRKESTKIIETDGSLENLSINNISYIENFGKNIQKSSDYCNSLLDGKSGYKIKTIAGKGKIGTANIYSKENINVVIKSIENVKIPVFLNVKIENQRQNPWNGWNIQEKETKKVIAIGGNNYSNQTNIHRILNTILKNKTGYVRQYEAFSCNNIGYNVMEYCTSGDLHSFLKKTTINDKVLSIIISHILTPLSVLSGAEYSFNHSDLKARNVFVHEKSKGNYYFKIADFDKSSITYNGFRFYNDTGDITAVKYSTSPILQIIGDHYIITGGLRTTVQLLTMHNPIGIPPSYDIYTFIISLFGIKRIRELYLEQKLSELKQTMHMLFPSEKYYTIMDRIYNAGDKLEHMQEINMQLVDIPLNINLDNVYKFYGIIPPDTTFTSTLNITTSKNNKLCITPCKSNPRSKNLSCDTNPYNTLTNTYKWDNCK